MNYGKILCRFVKRKMKLIVAGSRGFNDYDLLKKKLDFFINGGREVEIVSGTARGADQMGERYATENGFTIKRFPADWKLGKLAGHIRNGDMAAYATHCVVFWDGVSRGTRNMITLAKQYNLKLRVVYFPYSSS